MPLPPQSSPPAISAPAPTGPEAQEALLEAFDWGHSLPLMPKELKGQAALRYQWLRRAATFDPAGGLPTGPFLSGRERQEVEGLRRLAAIPHEQLEQALKALSLREAGSALALWRWGQVRVRTGAFDRATRRTCTGTPACSATVMRTRPSSRALASRRDTDDRDMPNWCAIESIVSS